MIVFLAILAILTLLIGGVLMDRGARQLQEARDHLAAPAAVDPLDGVDWEWPA